MKHMRFSITCLLMMLSGVVLAQATTYGNFKTVDQQLIYQKIFPQDSITAEKLASYYAAVPGISGVEKSSDQLKFRVADMTVDYLKFQFSQVATAQVIQSGKFSGDASIDVKDGKYRVTIANLTFTGNLGYKRVMTMEPLTNYACRNSGTYISSDWTKPNTLGLLDKAFTDKLQYVEKESVKGNGEW